MFHTSCGYGSTFTREQRLVGVDPASIRDSRRKGPGWGLVDAWTERDAGAPWNAIARLKWLGARHYPHFEGSTLRRVNIGSVRYPSHDEILVCTMRAIKAVNPRALV